MSSRLAGLTTIVTGASSGIGAGVASRFVAEGASVFAAARSEVVIDGVTWVPTDVTDPTAVDALIATAGSLRSVRDVPESLLERVEEPPRLRRAVAAAGEGGAAALAALRLELLRQAEAILVRRGFPVIPIYFYVVSGLLSPAVEGFHTELVLPDGSRAANLQDEHPLREVRVRRDGAR